MAVPKSFSFELHLIKSNPSHSDEPRIFLRKVNQNNKIVWAFEIDEVVGKFYNTHFDQSESSLWMEKLEFVDGKVLGTNFKKQVEDPQFSPELTSALEIFLTPSSLVFYSNNNVVYPARPVDRRNRANRKLIDIIEEDHVKFLEQQITMAKGSRNNDNFDYQSPGYVEQDQGGYQGKKKSKKR
jgi:hypothetical protein